MLAELLVERRGQSRLAVVDQKDIHQTQGFSEFGIGALNPEIHGVAAGQFYVREFEANGGLQRGMNVAEKQEFGFFVLGRNSRLEFLEDV